MMIRIGRKIRGWWRRMLRIKNTDPNAEAVRKDQVRRYEQMVALRPRVQRAADTLESLVEQALRGG